MLEAIQDDDYGAVALEAFLSSASFSGTGTGGTWWTRWTPAWEVWLLTKRDFDAFWMLKTYKKSMKLRAKTYDFVGIWRQNKIV